MAAKLREDFNRNGIVAIGSAVPALFVTCVLCSAAAFSGQVPTDTARTVTAPLPSSLYGNERSLRVHLPHNYFDAAQAGRRYPVLIMGDGFALFSPRSWNGPAIVDSLVAGGLIEPIILVGIDNAASIPGISEPTLARANEYLPYTDALEPRLTAPQGRLYPDFILNEVLPLLTQRFRIEATFERSVIGGSSYSAIAALHTATRFPTLFDGVLLESPPVFMFDGRMIMDVVEGSQFPARVYVGIGTKEVPDSVLLAQGRLAIGKFIEAAKGKGAQAHLLEVPDAVHSSSSWRTRFPVALQFFFGRSDQH